MAKTSARTAIDTNKLRAARGLMTQQEAAKRLGISKQLLSGYECGYWDPSIRMLQRICDVYGISPDRLLRAIDPEAA